MDSKLTAQEKLEKTKQNIIDATSFREPEKVPVGIDMIGPPFAYAGVTYEEVIDDPEKCAAAYCKIFDVLPIDFVTDRSLAVSPFKAFNALGMYDYALSGDKCSVVHHQAETSYEGPEVYDEIIEKGMEAYNETFLKKHFPALALPREDAKKALINACRYYQATVKTNQIINERLSQKGLFSLYEGAPYGHYAPFDHFFDRYRGIKNALTDLRRRHDKVKEACDAIWNVDKQMFALEPGVETLDPVPMANTIFHSECFLSPKQFDEFYWNDFKDVMMPLFEAGVKCYLLGEGSFKQILDRFLEIPKGSLVIQLDSDDPFEAYKIIGHHQTIATGISAELLQLGTKQQCVDYVKRCFDTFAPGGGFIFNNNKCLVSAVDANLDNLFAAFEIADKLSKGEG